MSRDVERVGSVIETPLRSSFEGIGYTKNTACYQMQVDCGPDCASISSYGFTPTLCDDPTWGPAHPDVCTDAALDAWAATHDGGAGG